MAMKVMNSDQRIELFLAFQERKSEFSTMTRKQATDALRAMLGFDFADCALDPLCKKFGVTFSRQRNESQKRKSPRQVSAFLADVILTIIEGYAISGKQMDGLEAIAKKMALPGND